MIRIDLYKAAIFPRADVPRCFTKLVDNILRLLVRWVVEFYNQVLMFWCSVFYHHVFYAVTTPDQLF